MRPSTFGALSVLMGVILLQAVSFAEKSGQCPYNKMNEVVLCKSFNKTACETDENCGGQQKCCRDLCTFNCKDPVEKSGMCPVPRTFCAPSTPAPKPLCTSDSDCPGAKKCCVPECHRKCTDPLPFVKPGSCPTRKLKCPKLKPNSGYPNTCSMDADCEGKMKCCKKCGIIECTEPQ